jgi:hypothetical protein
MINKVSGRRKNPPNGRSKRIFGKSNGTRKSSSWATLTFILLYLREYFTTAGARTF